MKKESNQPPDMIKPPAPPNPPMPQLHRTVEYQTIQITVEITSLDAALIAAVNHVADQIFSDPKDAFIRFKWNQRIAAGLRHAAHLVEMRKD